MKSEKAECAEGERKPRQTGRRGMSGDFGAGAEGSCWRGGEYEEK